LSKSREIFLRGKKKKGDEAMEADERILNELEELRQLFFEMKQHVSDIRTKMQSELGLVDEKTEEFEQLNGRAADLLEHISKYADTLKDILSYKTQVEELIDTIHKIDDYENRRDGIESTFNTLSDKINENIQMIESKILAFEVSCEEDLTAMNEKITATSQTKTKAIEQMQALEEQRSLLEDKLKKTAENAKEMENRVKELENSYNMDRIEKIDAFMSQKSETETFLLENTQALEHQKKQTMAIQETIEHSEDTIAQIKDRTSHFDAFLIKMQEEYDTIREKMNKGIKAYKQTVDTQQERIQQIDQEISQTFHSYQEAYQNQINTIAADEIEHLKDQVKYLDNDIKAHMNRAAQKLQDELNAGEKNLSKQTESGVRQLEAAVQESKQEIGNKLVEIEAAHQEQLKLQKALSEGEKNLAKNLKVNKWMMMINVMVMVLTITILFLSVFL